MYRTTARFLASAADAKDIVDINIAAGIALEELEELDRKSHPPTHRLRKTLAAVASFIVCTIATDIFAASPVHAGISPINHPHIFTRINGVDDWGDGPRASIFGLQLPWGEHDGWLMRLL